MNSPVDKPDPEKVQSPALRKKGRKGRRKSPVKRVLLRAYISVKCKAEIKGDLKARGVRGDTPGKVIERRFGFHYDAQGKRIIETDPPEADKEGGNSSQ